MDFARRWLMVGLVATVGCANPLPETEDDDTTESTGAVDADATIGAVDTGTGETEVAENGNDPECGNGVVEVGETCDHGGPSATCDGDCTDVVCGDGNVNMEADEKCDDMDLAGGTCQGLGFDGGTLLCGAGCAYDTNDCYLVPDAPVLALGFSQVKRFDFSWAAVNGADYYQLLESTSPGEPLVQFGRDIVGESVSFEMPLHFRWEASYVLRACNAAGDCTDSAAVDVVGSLAEAVGYVKASNADTNDNLGVSVAVSEDGNTLVVGAYLEDSNATGIDGTQVNDSAVDSGAAYVFVRDGMGAWSQQAYVKASNTGASDVFGYSVALSGDGNTLAVGAHGEDSNATGIDGIQADDSVVDSGAVYVFVRDEMGAWSQQAYVKASNPGASDIFGYSVAVSGDGNTVAVGTYLEDSNATGIQGGQANDSSVDSGAVYVFVRDGMGVWSQQVYVKPSNTGANDHFGYSVALSGDGDTLAVGAHDEDSNATGIGGTQANEAAISSGAVYVFVRDGMGAWSQQAYVKASNTGASDVFGWSVALSGDGNTLAVGAWQEDSNVTGVGGTQADESALESGAVYVFVRDGIGGWSQDAYVKASNTGASDRFGVSVAVSGDGNVLVVGAYLEDGNAMGIGGIQANEFGMESGAVYVFVRDAMGGWSQEAYVKASNTGVDDTFGYSVAVSGDGNTLAVGAHLEDSNATGIGGDQTDDTETGSGAVYLY